MFLFSPSNTFFQALKVSWLIVHHFVWDGFHPSLCQYISEQTQLYLSIRSAVPAAFKSAHFLLTRLCCCPWTHLWFWWVQRCFHTRHVSRDYLVKKLHYFRCVARNPFPVFCDDKVLSSAQVKILGKFSIFPLWLLYCQVHETANLITSWALICYLVILC